MLLSVIIPKPCNKKKPIDGSFEIRVRDANSLEEAVDFVVRALEDLQSSRCVSLSDMMATAINIFEIYERRAIEEAKKPDRRKNKFIWSKENK